ncbi:MAG TPA: aldehyde dehydrogenase family protein, partial [Deltaproteobacteria bacterium]|nr:aldehyde dehydrogenase family protein [Deltaproteobacteria bacterium]
LVMREESFGPVVGVMAVDSGEVALEYANEGNSGLAAYLFVPDTGTGLKMAQNLESGSVWINTIHQAYFSVPFGGFKESGLGREKSHYGIEEYLELKATYVSLEV